MRNTEIISMRRRRQLLEIFEIFEWMEEDMKRNYENG